ncbi:HNH endonuclease signature motif containing protein, partial [Brachybacterium sp. YJGR34]|uniref:HNH endonuclease signature motif containing protein n=1 Tax=Brachybacterium sp. YJGR34 TaxID=2059911 RepID=UPI00130024A7
MSATDPFPFPSASPSAEYSSGVPAGASVSGPVGRLSEEEAVALGQRIQGQAALVAELTCEFLLLVGEFDAREASGWYVGLTSTAHWLAWACSLTPGTAREQVRVARALRSMPRTVAEFRAGRLSYSKVREMSRVADRVEEEALLELARDMTASQLARTISSFRALDGARISQDAVRHARWSVREDGMVEVRALLPAETGAEVVTALELAVDRDGTPPPAARDMDPTRREDAEERAARIATTATLEQRRADALTELARAYLVAEPDDRSGEDRQLVVVQVSAEALPRGVPAETPAEPAVRGASSVPDGAVRGVPAGALPRCHVAGGGALEPATVERLACTGKVALAVTDAGGEVLHLGRARRLASRAQRRALRLRDASCVFPGCHRSRHLDAHHVTPWSQGGATDIEGLALLC